MVDVVPCGDVQSRLRCVYWFRVCVCEVWPVNACLHGVFVQCFHIHSQVCDADKWKTSENNPYRELYCLQYQILCELRGPVFPRCNGLASGGVWVPRVRVRVRCGCVLSLLT